MHSEPLQDAVHRHSYLPPRPQVVALLLPLHPPRGQDDEDGVLMQEVVDQDAAYFIVEPLLLLRPILTLGLVQLSHNLHALLVRVVSQPILQQRLVEVESLDRVLLWVAVFRE